jgi:hypothetical protein
MPEGPHFIWQQCFDVLQRTRNSTVLVSDVPEPINGEQRQGEELPDRFQLAARLFLESTIELHGE